MAFGAQTDWRREALPKPEFLQYPLYSTELDSAVINATGVTADASGPYAGRRYLVQGTVLSKRGDNQYERYTGASGQNVAGILYDTIEFADGTDVSDQPTAIVRRNASFKIDKIVDFATYESAIRSALSTCEFI